MSGMELVDWVYVTGWLACYAMILIGWPLAIYFGTRDKTKRREWGWFRKW